MYDGIRLRPNWPMAMHPSPDGHYVFYGDYKKLENEIARLRNGLQTIADVKTVVEERSYGKVKMEPSLESVKRYAREILEGKPDVSSISSPSYTAGIKRNEAGEELRAVNSLKYLVLKNEDAEEYLSESSKIELDRICSVINLKRLRFKGKPINKYLIVNVDEPYAGEVADLIESHERAKGTWNHEILSLREVMGISSFNALTQDNATLCAQLEQAQAANAELRAAVEKWKIFAHFTAMPVRCQTGEPLDKLIAECIQQGEKALASAKLENANIKER